jgi:hypothetical protein
MRGAPAIAELIVHAIVALILSAAVSVQSLYWSRLPHQTPPGAQLPLATIAVAHTAAWVAYLIVICLPRTPQH